MSTSLSRWTTYTAHRGTDIGSQVTRQGFQDDQAGAYLPFSVCSDEANIPGPSILPHLAWYLVCWRSDLEFQGSVRLVHGSTVRLSAKMLFR
jgi:hypothetical protein